MDVRADWENVEQCHYHPLGGTPDYWSSGQEWVKLLEAYPEVTSVLDYGCGDGRVARHLVDAGYVTSGEDCSESTLMKFIENVPEAAIHTRGQKYDAVLCLAVLIHYPANEGADIIRNIASLLQPEGIAVLNLYYGSKHDPDGFCEIGTWDFIELLDVLGEAGLEIIDSGEAYIIVRKVTG